MKELLAALSVVTCVVGCAGETQPPPPPVQPVKMLTIGEADSGAVREYPGTVSAAQRADLAFEVPGRMIAFPVDEGDEVAEGAVLGRLDARDYEARLDSARAVLRKAEADYRRSTNLHAQDAGAIALTKIDADKRGVEMADAQRREAEKAYEDTILRAPFAGIVGRKLVDDFANVLAKDPVLILQDTSELEMVVNVPERDFVGARPSERRSPDELTERLQPYVVVSALPERRFPARLKEVATAADHVTRTFAVTLRFANPDDVTILPGMTAKAVVRPVGAAADQVLLPAHAVTADADKRPFVWVVDPDSMRVARREVAVGALVMGGQVEVVSGLANGDAVATSGVALLSEGQQVRRFER
jgi:RND family efflux transporter MFP subunit